MGKFRRQADYLLLRASYPKPVYWPTYPSAFAPPSFAVGVGVGGEGLRQGVVAVLLLLLLLLLLLVVLVVVLLLLRWLLWELVLLLVVVGGRSGEVSAVRFVGTLIRVTVAVIQVSLRPL